MDPPSAVGDSFVSVSAIKKNRFAMNLNQSRIENRGTIDETRIMEDIATVAYQLHLPEGQEENRTGKW